MASSNSIRSFNGRNPHRGNSSDRNWRTAGGIEETNDLRDRRQYSRSSNSPICGGVIRPGFRHFMDYRRPDSSNSNALFQAINILAERLKTSELPSPPFPRFKSKKLILPYASEETRVDFVNHFGSALKMMIPRSPKVINYSPSLALSEESKSKVQSEVMKITDKLYDFLEKEKKCQNYIELGFAKMVFKSPKNQSLDWISAGNLESQNMRSNHLYSMSLSSPVGEKILLDILQQHGAVLKETVKRKHKISIDFDCKSFKEAGFPRDIRFGLDPLDLSFSKWIFEHDSTTVLANSRSDSGDLCVRGKSFVKYTKGEIEEMLQSCGTEFPSALCAPNLCGALHRDGETFDMTQGFKIREVYEVINCVKHVMMIENVQFQVFVYDYAIYSFEQHSRKFVKQRWADHHVKIRFPLPTKEDAELQSFVPIVTGLAMTVLQSLNSESLTTRIWSNNCLGRRESIPSVEIQRLRQRIVENDDLNAMLDLPADAEDDHVSEQLRKLLMDIKDYRICLSRSETAKLKEAASRHSITLD